uniref:Rhabdo_ncap domain-containing protein n=1 Tax=Syphacia muris TaxID=451379 RepID=A0A0N5AU51_9BILA
MILMCYESHRIQNDGFIDHIPDRTGRRERSVMYSSKKEPDAKIRKALMGNLPCSLLVEHALYTIHEVILDEDWTSYGLIIGIKRTIITPVDLLMVMDLDSTLLEIRPSLISQNDSRNDVMNRISHMLSLSPINMKPCFGVLNVLHWGQDQMY